jgi:hypothetical protein
MWFLFELEHVQNHLVDVDPQFWYLVGYYFVYSLRCNQFVSWTFHCDDETLGDTKMGRNQHSSYQDVIEKTVLENLSNSYDVDIYRLKTS